MASIELPLPHDPADYEPKAVAGKFSYRAFATIIAVVASEIPLIMRLISLGMDELPNTNLIVLLAALPAGVIALIGLSKREGLYFEQWFPPFVQELMTPTTILPVEALPTVSEDADTRMSKEDLKAAKAEEPVLSRIAEASVALATSGNPVKGRAIDAGAPVVSISGVTPELLVRHRLTMYGIKPRQARKLAKRGVEVVPSDMARTEEVSSHKWVSKRLARKACVAACEIAALTGPYDVRSEDELHRVLAAYGVDAGHDDLRLSWVQESVPATDDDSQPVMEAEEPQVIEDTVSQETDEPTEALAEEETDVDVSENADNTPKEGVDEVTVGVEPTEGDGSDVIESPSTDAAEPEGVEKATAVRTISVDDLFAFAEDGPIISRKAYRALIKADIDEVEIEPSATAQDLMDKYGICRKAAEQLMDAFATLA